ncbi:macrolide efflux RND transporter outer membrane subunit EtsC [Serratia ficaria]|uniref:Probable efflux pump outer membrane protein ttgC n=1 Tax=Serratia ficaria TaxID=61651 RepID=A0A240BU14_SERFI|nr:efflux transporter outer membrane subunit [Serratia ficaria]REF45315.1 NodT family efflux transporter outer membrane factor (OMF) lipoprotein [Serratia ficaria]CAI0881643.1 Probable efflux pump outer membrane protein ttgC precursor [Serratia ficaria]CAI0899382.1 Probable efflux pump outer membrane protein ttgC precursor [Serratia ficaria]CAI0933927.1 Probable efflux pump outer membrane protein ttgC precursor [Serratia ficaria]CAI2012797.1 Probable efflux pump outer membrane protein ttgC pre
MKILSPLALCLAALLSAGCGNALKSDYQTPQVAYPAQWQHADAGDVPPPFDWRDFRDPQLDRWLRQVMAGNNDLAAAVLRLYRARLNAERVDVSNAPSLSATLNAGSGRPLSESSPWTKSSSASLSTGYELDLWGKIARQRDAAEWASQASEQDLQAFRLTLLSDASNNYWRLGYINQQIAVSRQSIAYARDTLRLANARFHAGSISALDVVNAERSLLTQENHLLALRHQRQQALNVQTVLLGAPPGHAVVEPAHLPTQPLPQVNGGIPASVLGNRPDIRAKELQLRAALANVDIKRAEYYPTFNLTGSLGTSSTALLEFLRNPIGTVGASLTLPFLQWRQMGLDVKIARNDYEQRVLAFKQSLYKAMADVDDALSLRAQLMAQETHQRAVLALARKSERLNELRYRQGAVAITDWLDAQEQRRQAELALDENRFSQYQNLAKIYLEFGGSPP